jgi:REP-associated tyrosine transposase
MTTSHQLSDYPRRRPIRLPGYDYANPGAYFVTICAHERRCLFGRIADTQMIANAFGKAVETCWLGLANHYAHLSLDAFIVMPNHIHGILFFDEAPEGQHGLFETVRALKTFSARRINKLRNQPGNPVWQRGYHEHVVRNDMALDQIRRYIANNPARWQYDRENPANESTTARRAGLKPAPTEKLDTENVGAGFKPARRWEGA